MAGFCIVCEYNPLHNGHVYLIERARELGADTVTCIMSGNATQRGEFSITDKYLRAEAAIKCGADLVLELPYPWCASSADYFATAALSLVSPFGEKLIFGSECGDVNALVKAAEFCESKEFKDEFEAMSEFGLGAAEAYLKCLEDKGFREFSSNDLLGISYIRAIKRMNLNISPIAIKRLGAAFNCKDTVDGDIQSATALRKYIEDGKTEDIREYVPFPMLKILEEQIKKGNVSDIKEIDAAVVSFFRLASAESLGDIAEASGGLANRICSMSHVSNTYAELFERSRTKRYTDAKIRRAMLFCMTGVKRDSISVLPEYTVLLGANERGRELLSENRRNPKINVITKPADAPQNTEQYRLSQRLEALYGLARKNKLITDSFMKKMAYIEK